MGRGAATWAAPPVRLAKGGTHFNHARTLAQGGGPPGRPVAAPDERRPSRQGLQRAGPQRSVAVPPDGWGTTAYPLMKRQPQLKKNATGGLQSLRHTGSVD